VPRETVRAENELRGREPVASESLAHFQMGEVGWGGHPFRLGVSQHRRRTAWLNSVHRCDGPRQFYSEVHWKPALAVAAAAVCAAMEVESISLT
jgi:hypothetical protein